MGEKQLVRDSQAIEADRRKMRDALTTLISNYESRDYEFYPTEYTLIKEARKALKEV